VNENVSDDSLVLLVCVSSSDVTIGFTVTLSTQSGTAIGDHIFCPVNLCGKLGMAAVYVSTILMELYTTPKAHITASYMQ